MSDPVQPLPNLPAQEQQTAQEGYIHRSLVGLDEMVNVLLDGSPDETISSRMARWATEDSGIKQHIGSAVCKALNLVSPDHGAKAIAGDLERAETIVQTEESTPTVKEEGQ